MGAEKRKEQRYAMGTEAVLERKSGEQVPAFTLNVSGSGMLLEIKTCGLLVGEEVRCGIKLYKHKPPQSWGSGTVVRVDGARVAIDFDPQQER